MLLTFNYSTWLTNNLDHRCFLGVLEILEQLIFEDLQTDDSAVKKRLTRIHLLKFQIFKQLFSNPQLVHVTAMESLKVF